MRNSCFPFATLILAVACGGRGDSGQAPPLLDAGMDLGSEVTCRKPVSSVDDIVDIGESSGITEPLPTTELLLGRSVTGAGGAVSIGDLDADGDLDVLIGSLDGEPDLYINDGNGFFEHRVVVLEDGFGAHTIHIADINGDGWPDLIPFGVHAGGGVYRNDGGYRFTLAAPFEDIEGIKHSTIMTGMVGDLDGDGDLDIAIPTMSTRQPPNSEQPPEGAPDMVLVQDAPMSFAKAATLVGPAGATTSQVGWLSDRDNDGDLDFLVLPDRGPAAAWWRNDGQFPVQEDAEDVLGLLFMSAMGLDSTDIDEDGTMDVCISDVGTPRCLLGSEEGRFRDASAVFDFPVDEPISYGEDGSLHTIGWSVALVDLDADGTLDVLQASGPEEGAVREGFAAIGDLLWHGKGGFRYEDRSHESGFWDTAPHVGLATGDLDGDGFLEIVRAGPGLVPQVHSMPCTDGAWLQVRLAGPSGDTIGFGARVTVKAGSRTWREEVLGIRDKAQGAPWQTFGLGDRDQVDEVVVTWPDGTQQRAENVPTRRTLTVAHPRAVDPAPYPGR